MPEAQQGGLSRPAGIWWLDSQQAVQLRVDVQERVPVVMRTDQDDPGPVGFLEGDDNPQGAAQVLDGHPVNGRGTGQPVGKCPAAACREIVQARPGIYWESGPSGLRNGRSTRPSPRFIWATLSRRSARFTRAESLSRCQIWSSRSRSWPAARSSRRR